MTADTYCLIMSSMSLVLLADSSRCSSSGFINIYSSQQSTTQLIPLVQTSTLKQRILGRHFDLFVLSSQCEVCVRASLNFERHMH